MSLSQRTERHPAMIAAPLPAIRNAGADFDYSGLDPTAEGELRSRAEAIRGILGERFIIRSAPDVVRLGRLLTLVRDCLGQARSAPGRTRHEMARTASRDCEGMMNFGYAVNFFEEQTGGRGRIREGEAPAEPQT